MLLSPLTDDQLETKRLRLAPFVGRPTGSTRAAGEGNSRRHNLTARQAVGLIRERSLNALGLVRARPVRIEEFESRGQGLTVLERSR